MYILHRFRDTTTFPEIYRGHATPNTSLSGITDALVLLCVSSQHAKFEVPSFTDSKDMIGAKI